MCPKNKNCALTETRRARLGNRETQAHIPNDAAGIVLVHFIGFSVTDYGLLYRISAFRSRL